jgi:hypothetical protein
MIMDYVSIIQKMKAAGVCFSSGLTHDTIAKIEKLYEIRFPDSLRTFYQTALPISVGDTEFPRWDDFSQENINLIRERIHAPYRWLMLAIINHPYWLSSWGERPLTFEDIEKRVGELFKNAPTLLPIYSHRYIPVMEGIEDPPIISSVGQDTVYYGHTLEEYLKIEFLNDHVQSFDCVQRIPFWSDIIEGNR